MTRVLVPLLALLITQGAVAERAPLPEPLTLEAALTAVQAPHPSLRQIEALRRLAEAERQSVEAETGPKLSLEGRLRWVEPNDLAPYQDNDDHQLALRYSQQLYDFGRSEARRAAAGAELGGSEHALEARRYTRRLEIMRNYFDVLLADMSFDVDNEAMAVAFISVDRLRNRAELGQVSEVDLYEAELAYQQSRRAWTLAQSRQRASRARLALALDRPGELSSELLPPELPQLERERPDYETLLQAARHGNPQLRALNASVEAARRRLDAARLDSRPRLRGEVEALGYSHDEPGYDRWRAGVVLEVPIYDGATGAAAARARAELYAAETELELARRELEARLLELWLELEELQVAADEALAGLDFRDLYLERSRANYEMQVQADLGDAMVRMTEAQLEQARRDFRTALVWEEIDALLGGPLDESEE